jgi:pimeloyl-ACP methyl ester carboxylesterase
MPTVRPPRLRAAWPGLVYAAFVLASSPGCSTIRVERTDFSGPFWSWRSNVLFRGRLSPRTLQTLRQWDLEREWEKNPGEATARLHERACQAHQPDLLYALAEIHFLRGREAERCHDPDALAHYYLCAGYAFHYLFDVPPPDVPDAAPASVFDPRYRLACDLYNAGLAECIAAAQRVRQLDPSKEKMDIPTRKGEHFLLSVKHVDFPWKEKEFGPLLFCKDFRIEGLVNHYRTYGLGVPLIATRSANAPTDTPDSRHFPPHASFPVTAFLRFPGSVADLVGSRTGELEMYNPLTVQAVAVCGRHVPLETDLTTPLGYFLAQGNLEESAYTGFVWAGSLRSQEGLRMLAPYERGKIPVVLVHGLLSSPLTWAPVINDLQADPVLRRRFQFWYYFYPTGEPYLYTAAHLRRELNRLRQELDPEHTDPALDQMVLAGHSMGGLIAHLLTVDSGDDFWRLVSKVPLDRLGLEKHPEVQQELQETFYFRQEDCVRRVIFLATPHYGSQLSLSVLGRLAGKLVFLPRGLKDAIRDLAKDKPELEGVLRSGALDNSVDLLAPVNLPSVPEKTEEKNPVLQLLASRPRPPAVRFHSVMGILPASKVWLENLFSGDYREGDGVVPYPSAHLEGTQSELVVEADHFHVHHHPMAILEMRRILLEHLQEVDRSNVIVPVGHAAREKAPPPAPPAKTSP